MSSSSSNFSHLLHSGYSHPLLRQWQCSPSIGSGDLHPSSLMLPLFIIDSPDEVQEIGSMPGVKRFGVNAMADFVKPLVGKGLKSVLLFSVTSKPKNSTGDIGADDSNPMIAAIKLLKSRHPDLLVACDVCLCPYTDHGHCGILGKDGFIDNERSIKKISEISVKFALAGADVIAPSDMMDGRVGEIKKGLKEIGYLNRVSVMSYSVKFASGFYGPFREAAHSAPAFGDRKRYQLPVGSRGLAMRAAERDVQEGADMLMVKPGLAYLDVVREVKNRFPDHPMAIYQVSGEFAMLHHGAAAGAFDLRGVLTETLTCMRRSGADIIITYFTPLLLDWILEDSGRRA